MAERYYTLLNDSRTNNEAESECNYYGKHLASIHETSNMRSLSDICQCDYCWIGLEGHKTSYNRSMLQWTDDTSIDTAFITTALCNDYPQINDYGNKTYYTYIDPQFECLKTTTNDSLVHCGICGPTMVDATSGMYFVCYIVIPLLLCPMGFIYSLCASKTLRRELYRNRSIDNWVLRPSKSIKQTAIWTQFIPVTLFLLGSVYSFLLVLAYAQTGILAPVSWIDTSYPKMYIAAGIVYIIICILYALCVVLIYIHLLSRLKLVFNNRVFGAEVSSMCEYHITILLIAVYCTIFIIYAVIDFRIYRRHRFRDIYKASLCFVSFLGAVDIAINILLLFLYCKMLYKFKIYFFRYNLTDINDEFNDVMIEFRRNTVLFVLSCVVNIITTTLAVVMVHISLKSRSKGERNATWRYIANIICMVSLFLKLIVSLQSIYCSFNFHHMKYKKYYKWCDKWMEKKCNKAVSHKNRGETMIILGGNMHNDIDFIESNEPLPLSIDDYFESEHKTESSTYS